MKNEALPMPSDDELLELEKQVMSQDSEKQAPMEQGAMPSVSAGGGMDLSDDELSQLEKDIEYSKERSIPEDIARTLAAGALGVGQGVALNFGDEILAGLEYAARGGTKPYQEIQKEYEQAYKKMQEESPIASGIGEFAGGMLIPGGAVVKAGKAGAGLLGKVVTGGITGAALSTLSQLGATEKDVLAGDVTKEELEEAAKLGAGLGAGLPIAGAALSKIPVKQYIDASPKIRRWIEAFKLESGKRTGEPINLTESALKEGGRQAGSQKVIKRVEEITKDITEPIINIKNELGDEINKILTASVDPIKGLRKQPDFEDLLDKLKLGGEIKGKLLNEFEDIIFETRPVLDPITGKFKNGRFVKNNISVADLNEAYNIVKQLKKEDLQKLGLNTKQINYFLGGGNKEDSARNLLNKLLEKNSKELVETKKQFFETSRLGELILNEIKSDPNAITKNITDYTDEELRTMLQKMLVNKIKTAGSISTAGDIAIKDVYDIVDSLQQYNKLLAQKAKGKKTAPFQFDTEKLEEEIKQRAEGYGALVGSKGIEATQDVPTQAVASAFKDAGALSNLMLSSGLQVAGKLGRATTKQPVKGTIEGYNKMYSAVEKMAQSNVPGAKKLGEVLKTALDNKMSAGSVAGLNTLLQQSSEARDAFKYLDNLEEE